MPRSLLVVTALLALLLLDPATVPAEGSWWEKGLSILTDLGGQTDEADEPTLGEIGKALKQALRLSSNRVVKQLGATDGFNNDTAVHIPLPQEYETARTILAKFGMEHLLDDLELKLNRAAEAATPKAKKLFWQAIKEMTFDDIKGIYEGPDNAATTYFQSKMSAPLAEEMAPIVKETLAEVGALQAYDDFIEEYRNLPLVPDLKADLTSHVVAKGMDGIFYYIAQEEAAIRKDPEKRTTALLKKVFGSE